MKGFHAWQQHTANILDACFMCRTQDFRYEVRPEGTYFSTEENLVWFLKGHTVLTADTAGQRFRQTEGLHKVVSVDADNLVVSIQKWIRTATGVSLLCLTLEDGADVFVRTKYVNRMPPNALMYYDDKQKCVVAGLRNGNKLEPIAGFPIYSMEEET